MLSGGALQNHDDHDKPAQASLFGEAANTNARIDPKRALLRFGVRRDATPDGDIPLVRPKQLGLHDGDVDRDELVRDVRHGEELSEREILRILEGTDASGHQRARLNEEINEMVEAFFHAAKAQCGYHKAVCMLFSMVSGAPSFLRVCPEWMISVLFIEERDLIFEVFHGGNGDRRPELGESEDE